ncbi:MAG: hypothetical protein AAFX44_02210 [Pseudomonadota bacterium]
MTYLLVKYALLFLLASVAAFLLGRWSVSRKFVDVTESYEDFRKVANSPDAGRWAQVSERLDQLPVVPPVNLAGVTDRLDALAYAVTNMQAKLPSDLSSVDRRFDQLSESVGRVARLVDEASPDLGPLDAKLASLAAQIDAIQIPDTPAPIDLEPLSRRLHDINASVRDMSPEKVDLQPLHDRVQQVADDVRAIQVPKPGDLVNLQPIFEQLDLVRRAVQDIPSPEAPKHIDLEPMTKRLADVETAVRNIPLPVSPATIDLEPLSDQLRQVADDVRAIRIPEAGELVDLTPVIDRLDHVQHAVGEFSLPEPESAPDLGPIQGELSDIRLQFESLRQSQESIRTDLSPVQTQIKAVDQRLSSMAILPNIARMDQRLSSIEGDLKSLRRSAAAASPLAPDNGGQASASFLATARYGAKDDLRQISGVGPKLEQLLNSNGVFYFWQIASWSEQDIDSIDTKLENFKGRIIRDDWVSQAMRLHQGPGAAKQPQGYARNP